MKSNQKQWAMKTREREWLGFEFVEKEARASKYIRVIL